MTPEKLSLIKELVLVNRWFEIIGFVPELISEVERLQRKNEELQSDFDDYCEMYQERNL